MTTFAPQLGINLVRSREPSAEFVGGYCEREVHGVSELGGRNRRLGHRDRLL
jgi:hypothetical protein